MAFRSDRGGSAAWCERPVLTIADLEAYDPRAPAGGVKRRFCCPLPGSLCADKPVDGTHRSLEVQRATGLWRCYRCGNGGRLREFWQARPPARAVARRAFGLGAPAGSPVIAETQLAPLPLPPPLGHGRAAHPANDRGAIVRRFDWCGMYGAADPIMATTPAGRYLAGRGIPIELAAAAGVRGTAVWYGRPAVLFPMRDWVGELVAITGRYLDTGARPKARTGGALKLGVFATVGALDADPLVITEAPIDALSLAACGTPALALGGASWPVWMPRRCAFRQVVIATDADPAGDAAAAKVFIAIQSFGARVTRWRPAAGKDWNAVLQAHGAQQLRAALDAVGVDPAKQRGAILCR